LTAILTATPWELWLQSFLRRGEFQNVLPEMFLHLFPEHAAFGWVREPQYELPNVTALLHEIADVEAAARRIPSTFRIRRSEGSKQAIYVQVGEGPEEGVHLSSLALPASAL
jgi:hypothetical protein